MTFIALANQIVPQYFSQKRRQDKDIGSIPCGNNHEDTARYLSFAEAG